MAAFAILLIFMWTWRGERERKRGMESCKYNYSYREITKVTIKSHVRRHVDVGNGTTGRV
jgi:hypothetical protein